MAFNLNTVSDFIGQWAKNTTEASQDWRELAAQADRELAAGGQALQEEFDQGGAEIESNIRQGIFAGYGARAGAWLSKPVNMLIALGAVIGIVWAVFSLSRN